MLFLYNIPTYVPRYIYQLLMFNKKRTFCFPKSTIWLQKHYLHSSFRHFFITAHYRLQDKSCSTFAVLPFSSSLTSKCIVKRSGHLKPWCNHLLFFLRIFLKLCIFWIKHLCLSNNTLFALNHKEQKKIVTPLESGIQLSIYYWGEKTIKYKNK